MRKTLQENEAEINIVFRKSRGSIPKQSVFWPKSILRYYCIQHFKDIIQIRAYEINKEGVTHFIPFISVKIKEILRKFQAQFRKN